MTASELLEHYLKTHSKTKSFFTIKSIHDDYYWSAVSGKWADARYARKFDTKQEAINYLTDNLKSEMTTIVEVYGFR